MRGVATLFGFTSTRSGDHDRAASSSGHRYTHGIYGVVTDTAGGAASLVEIDPTTARLTPHRVLQRSRATLTGGAWCSTRACGFASNGNALYRIEATTGVVERVGVFADSRDLGRQMSAIAIDAMGKAIAITHADSTLYEVDLATARLTRRMGSVWTTGAYHFSTMTYGPDGALYGFAESGTNAFRVHRIDPYEGIVVALSHTLIPGAYIAGMRVEGETGAEQITLIGHSKSSPVSTMFTFGCDSMSSHLDPRIVADRPLFMPLAFS